MRDEERRIVTDEYLINQLGLTPAFINQHARRMGSFSRKPRRFFLHHVMTHLEALAQQSIIKAHGERNLRKREVKAWADRVLEMSLIKSRRKAAK